LTGKDNSKVPAAICFSSGTSGKPKGVILSHYNLIAYLLAGRASTPFLNSSRSREVFFPSFAHIYGLVAAVLQPAYVGSYLVVMSEFDFLPYLRRCSEIHATVIRLVPSTAIRMTKDPATRNLNLKSVQTVMCSSASLATETVQELQKILNPEAKIVNGYGMTEASITILRESQSHRAGSVGRPSSGVTIRVVDDHMEDVVPGKDGQCIVKSPTVFMCYKDNPEETAASFHDGWLLTGDIVRVDEDGYFWITGRKKELIKYKGNQIAPAELDAILLSHPLVTDAAVVGIPTKEKDSEVPLGCVSLASSVEARDIENVLEQIKKFVDAKVSPYKRLRGGLFHVEVLPKTSTGKVMRRTLPEIVAGKRKVANAAKL
jgi:acyl-coenzyme A synthetase/AMP-(fatty) acid ligase